MSRFGPVTGQAPERGYLDGDVSAMPTCPTRDAGNAERNPVGLGGRTVLS